MSASAAVVNRLAAELHRNYRAAEKALNGPDKTDRDPSLKDGVTLRHDHGWESCHKQKYFRRRAQTLITRATCLNPQTLGEAEQALDSMVLIRRLIVNDAPLPRHIEAFMRNVAEAPAIAHQEHMIEELCAAFQVPEYLVTGNTGEARRKAQRDATIRKTLWPVRTNAISGPQNGRGLL
jgi:hypothetical protein